ncbi:hypothetical protein ACFV2Q_33225 [Streptomyces sp. NPDC059650]|uniref:hypothetical protein n=1 Tax=Streptomyces sp. NPDC059650 TaxID=3346896 RepID=UPI003694D7A4
MTLDGDAYALNHALVSALARRNDVLLLPVLEPADADVPSVNPLTMLLLARLRERTAERDAFRDWVTQDPPPPSDDPLRARAAEAANNLPRRHSP